MVRGSYRRGRCVGAFARAAVIVAGCGLAACSMPGQPTLGAALPGAMVAFDSIDGPPEAVFRRLVAQLNQEAGARQIAVVSREEPAQYRIRGYLAAHTQARRATIMWVWDIYTADRQRAMRIAGEVPGATGERNAWAAADDQAIGRLARDGMDRLVAFLAAPTTPDEAPASPPQERGPDVALAPADQGALAYLPPLRPQ